MRTVDAAIVMADPPTDEAEQMDWLSAVYAELNPLLPQAVRVTIPKHPAMQFSLGVRENAGHPNMPYTFYDLAEPFVDPCGTGFEPVTLHNLEINDTLNQPVGSNKVPHVVDHLSAAFTGTGDAGLAGTLLDILSVLRIMAKDRQDPTLAATTLGVGRSQLGIGWLGRRLRPTRCRLVPWLAARDDDHREFLHKLALNWPGTPAEFLAAAAAF